MMRCLVGKIRKNHNESAGESRDVNHKSAGDGDGDDGARGLGCRHYFICVWCQYRREKQINFHYFLGKTESTMNCVFQSSVKL